MVEGVVVVFLCVLQGMPAVGPWISLMFVPLGYYLLLYLLWYPEYLEHNLRLILSPRTLLGQAVAFMGLMLFLAACIQLVRQRGKLVTTGLYSVVRHPQYLGITVMTLGTSIISVQLRANGYTAALFIWLVEVLGYVLLACFEERSLLREHEEVYQRYRVRAPLIFPVASPARIPEPLFSMVLATIIAFVCMFL
ncbi:MAG: methyltransferase [Candidatus Bathyarchaeia archaeon]